MGWFLWMTVERLFDLFDCSQLQLPLPRHRTAQRHKDTPKPAVTRHNTAFSCASASACSRKTTLG